MAVGAVLGWGSVQLLVAGPKGVRAGEREVDPTLAPPARREAQVKALRELARELGAKGPVHLAVPRSEAILRRMPGPPVPEPELAQIVRLQAKKDLPFDPAEVELCFARATKEDLVYAGVRRTVIQELKATLAEAGLKAGRLEVSSQAAARAAHLLAGPIDKEVLLVLIEPRTCEALVLAPGRPPFARGASAGSADDPAAARAEKLGAELVRTLGAARADRGEDPGGPPGRLLVAGRGAADAELVAALAARVGCEAKVISGLDGEAADGARYLLARGLADPRPVEGLAPLDLGHHAEATARRDLKNRATWLGVAAGVLVLAALVGGRVFLSARAAAIEELEAERERIASKVKEAKRLQEELDRAETWSLRRGRELEVMLLVARALPPDEAYLTQVRWQEGGEVRLAGRAKEWEAAGRFFSALEQDPRVERAAPDDIRRAQEKEALGVQFSGTARLKGEQEGTP